MRYFSPYEKGYGLRNYPFRVWDKVAKQMSYNRRDYFYYRSKPERYVLMHCTEEYDTNGVLIYEYDTIHQIGVYFRGSPLIDMSGIAMKPYWDDHYSMVRTDGCSFPLRDDVTYVTGNTFDDESADEDTLKKWSVSDAHVVEESLHELENSVYNLNDTLRYVVPVRIDDIVDNA